MKKKARKPAPWEAFFDALFRGMEEGKIKAVTVGPLTCGRCKIGTFKSDPTPNWMHRWTCTNCGKRISR